jgi:hypothetical protein
MSQSNPINGASVQNIMNRRALVRTVQVGKKVILMVQGNGNVIDVKTKEGEAVGSIVDGTPLQKQIFNTKANSELAMKNPRNMQLLRDAIKAEKAGEHDKADELFSQYLNAVQFSFSVLLPSPIASKLGANVEIAGQVQMVTTDNGSLITLDQSTISLQAPEELGKTTFSLDDVAGEDAPVETAKPVAAEA